MRRRRAAAVMGVSLVLPSVAGVVAMAADSVGDRAAPAATTVATTPVATSTTSAPSSTSAPPSTTVRPTATTAPSTTTTTTTTTTTPTPTVAPIVTHDARVGVGVLTPATVSAPVRVVIPSIGADGPVSPTGVDDAGQLAIPADAGELVWWKHGPTPGAPGSAVIAGHLDWKGVLGVFNRLADTPVGERVTVTYDDGHEQVFVVVSVELIDKPAVAVNGTFARDGAPVLRLVTCGGQFDRSVRHYTSNVVVTAVPA